MNIALRKPWTQEQFFAWAEAQEGRYEFDGFQPVAMTGGNAGHDRITGNINAALRQRLRGTPCSNHGPNLGVQTVGLKIRYPDALITCTKFPPTVRLAPDVIIVFEVLSPGSGQFDRIVKVREYAAVPSIRRYVIVESSSVGLTVLQRESTTEAWRTTVLTSDDITRIPEIGIEIPVSEIYEGIEFSDEAVASE